MTLVSNVLLLPLGWQMHHSRGSFKQGHAQPISASAGSAVPQLHHVFADYPAAAQGHAYSAHGKIHRPSAGCTATVHSITQKNTRSQ
jgi:hypothetical protein